MPKLFLQNSAQKLRTTRKCKDGFYYNKGFLSFPIRKSRTESTEPQDGGFTKIPFSEGRRFEPHSSRQIFFFCNFCIFPFYFETTLLNKCKKCNKKNLFSTMGFEPVTHSRGCFYWSRQFIKWEKDTTAEKSPFWRLTILRAQIFDPRKFSK